MARGIRVEYPGAFYHVMARGNRRERIFRDDADRRFFCQTLGEACERTGWNVHAWVLMSNHYHLMLETPEPTLVAGMKWMQNTYTRRYNSRHKLWGRLFGDRYKAVLSEGDSRYYYCSLMDYIHLNPVRVGLVRIGKGESVRDYPWSSVAAGYALPARQRASWLAAGEGLAMAQCPDTAAGRRRFVAHLDQRAHEEGSRGAGVIVPENDRRRSHLRHGWYWGSQAFAEAMLKLAERAVTSRTNRTYRSGAISRAHDEREAKRLLSEGLAAAGLEKEALGRLPGSDVRKTALANLLLERTVARQSWIAERLAMRSAANVSQQVRRYRIRNPKVPSKLKAYLQSVKIC
jgi:REP element-mobilizing transposase RayT